MSLDHELVWNDETRALRKSEAQMIMRQLGPLLADTTKHVVAADDLETAAERASLPDAGLEAIAHLAEAGELISSVTKMLALYLMEHHEVSRREIAQATGLSSSTIQRWAQAKDDSKEG